ncbi:MAG TPA: protein kinase [Polyangium sp.]|nr:protein kinase [Polyangium sp.]
MSYWMHCTFGETLHESPDTIVRRALHPPTGERLIAKMLVGTSGNQRLIGRLIHEHRLLVKLGNVPGVVRTRAIEQMGTQAVLWLEDQGLPSLDQVIAKRHPLPLLETLQIALETARALERVHEASVVHKDIKPQNILWDEATRSITLLDFAIASELSEEATNAAIPEALEGTLAYMSPEQTGRTARGLDTRTDLYSLGVMFFELLAGQRPFLETDPLALVHAHLAKPPPNVEELNPTVPWTVAHIVERCLEKHPEHRYQTAKGLAEDIAECIRQWAEHGAIESFVLGCRDYSPILHLPQTLVSREAEGAKLHAAFERAGTGTVEVLVLGGPSGIGKTALVRSVYREMAKLGRGQLLSGKHDQLGRNVPYAALAQAFGGFVRDLAASPKNVFDAWRERIDRALGPLSRVIADIVPELEWLMGPLPPLPVVPTQMTYNRLKLAWIQFVRVVADASPPLVLFLDDVQWADPASFAILNTLLTDVERKNLLLIAAYRDNEVDPGHPLWALVESLQTRQISVAKVTVGPLDEKSVGEWLGVALSSDPSRLRSLGNALHAKTHGNPFFLGQLLLELHRQKRIRRDPETGQWQWDQEAILRAAATDNVIELMRQKVVELPLATQTLLGQAACAGHSFTLAELSILAGVEHAAAVQGMRPALLAGLLIPQDGHYREAQAFAEATENTETHAGYRFLHDRVQQAFYERIDPDKRIRTHLVIGRRLETVFEKEGGSNQKLLEIVRHLNLGASALTTDDERRALARQNLQAARAAKVNGSYRLQASLVEQAQALLGPGAWQDEPSLSVELALERIEADYMLKEFGEVHRRAQELLTLPLPNLPRLAAHELRVRACLASGQYIEGEMLGIAALTEQGMTYPETNDECIVLALKLLAECDEWLDAYTDGFSTMPLDTSLEHLLCDALEASMTLCAGFGKRPVLAVVSVAGSVLRTTRRNALTPVAPFLIGCMGNVRAAMLGQYRSCARWAYEGESAAGRLASPMHPECLHFRGIFATYEMHIEKTLRYHVHAMHVAAASGSFQGTSWGVTGELSYVELWGGRPLRQLQRRLQSAADILARAGDALGQHGVSIGSRLTTILTASRITETSDDPQYLRVGAQELAAKGDGLNAEMGRIHEAQLAIHFGEYQRALASADEADLYRAIIYGLPPVTDIPLWQGLAAAKCWATSLSDTDKSVLLAKVRRSIEQFRYLAEGCPDNFLPQLRLLEAEYARINLHTDEAMVKYDEAINLITDNYFLQIRSLAAKFAAEFYLERNIERIAAIYLQVCRESYTRWEASSVIAYLDDKYPQFVSAKSMTSTSSRTTTISTTETTDNVALDGHTAIRAAQTLSSELDPERVIGRLMELCMANAGAERGALVFIEDDAWHLASRVSMKDAHIETGLSIPLAQCTDVATTVVHYVARSREPVVIDDVAQEKRFTDDPYLAEHHVRSLLALPLTHRGRLGGVLYLEHRQAAGAFSRGRVEFLAVLASQAAIAVENATLYRNIESQLRALEARNREVQHLNDELRRQIAQRSRRLMDSLLPHDTTMVAGGSFTEGSLLGDCYRVLRLVGEGGMGAVYEVERTTDGLHLAAKVLNHAPDRSDLGRFTREAEILAKLSHPNLISIHDIDVTDQGILYIVMDFVAGSTLRAIDGHVGDLPWILGILKQVGLALEVLHAQSIVHRDLKPDNILVVAGPSANVPVVKLADFGISIVTNDSRTNLALEGLPARDTNSLAGETTGERASVLTQTGALVGTPFYMAPELGYGSKNALPSADIFALGVIAFELLTGARPYSFPPVLGGMIDVHAREKLAECPGLSGDLVQLFIQCIDAKPDQRPTASAVVMTLSRH